MAKSQNVSGKAAQKFALDNSEFGLDKTVQSSLMRLVLRSAEVKNLRERQIFMAAAANGQISATAGKMQHLKEAWQKSDKMAFIRECVELMDTHPTKSGAQHVMESVQTLSSATKDSSATFQELNNKNVQVMTEITKQSFQTMIDTDSLKFQKESAVGVSSALGRLTRSVVGSISSLVPVELIFNITGSTENILDDVLSGNVPSLNKSRLNVSQSVPSKTDNVMKVFSEGLEDDAGAFGVFKQTHRNMAHCHYIDLDEATEGRQTKAARMVNEGNAADAFRIIAIPALASAVEETESSFVDKINGGADFGWTRYMNYACVDVYLLTQLLHDRYFARRPDSSSRDTDDVEDLETNLRPDKASLQVVTFFKQKLRQEDDDFRLPNPLHDNVAGVSMPKYVFKQDMIYIADWCAAHIRLELYLAKHSKTLSTKDLSQIAALGRRMGYDEKLYEHTDGLLSKLVDTRLFASALVGLGFGLASKERSGKAAAASAVFTALSARVGAQLQLFNPASALVASMVAEVVNSLNCVRSINDIYFGDKQYAQPSVARPLAWTLMTKQIYSSGVINFCLSMMNLVMDLVSMDALTELRRSKEGGSAQFVKKGTLAAYSVLTTVFDQVDNLVWSPV